jgi:hypothetical protein
VRSGARRGRGARGREEGDELEVSSVIGTLGDAKLWARSGRRYLYAQLSIIGFGVLFLRRARPLGRAALVIAVSQVIAIALRIGAGAGRMSLPPASPLVRIGAAISRWPSGSPALLTGGVVLVQ